MERKRIICIDLDGVLLSFRSGWLRDDVYGKVLPGAKEGLAKLVGDNWHVIVYTCRKNRKKIEEVLRGYGILKGIHYHAINRRKNSYLNAYKGKIGADVYVDDRAICFEGSWEKTYERIKQFKPWEER